jgi:sugar phosphate permease
VRNNKWLLLGLLWVAFFLHQGTRQVFNAMLPQIQAGLGVADSARMGLAVTVFTLTYGLAVTFAGVAGDLFRRKTMIVGGLFLFCSGIFASGFAAGIGLLILTYGFVNGVGQAFFYPSTCSLLSQAHGDKTRATALSILQTALYTGIITCSCVSGKLGSLGADSWRAPFWLFGGIGLLWAACLALLIPDIKPAPSAAGGRPSFREALSVMFRKPSALLLAFAFGMMIYVDVGFKTWMPGFLQSKGLTPGAAAFNAVIWHYAGAILGVLAASRLTDRLAPRRPTARFEANIAGLTLGAPFIFWMAHAPSHALCFAALFGFGLFRGVYDSNLFASLFDVIPARYRASASGLMLCFAFVFGSSASTVLGWMRDHSGMAAGLASLAAFYLAGGCAILAARQFFFKHDYVKEGSQDE